MEKKILMIMASLVVVAALVVAVVMVAAGGGLSRAGGFTNLFDKLVYTGNATEYQRLSLPQSWHEGDQKTVTDVIVDMTYYRQTVQQTSVYITTLWFVYLGDKWAKEYLGDGNQFYVPDKSHDGLLPVDNGLFYLTVSSATNISAKYDVGESITLQTTLLLNRNAVLAFGDWTVANTM